MNWEGFIPGMQGWHNIKTMDATYQINRVKKKKHVSISVAADKALTEFCTHSSGRLSANYEQKETLQTGFKENPWKKMQCVNIFVLSDKILNTSHWRSGKGCPM